MSNNLSSKIINILKRKEHVCYAPYLSLNFDAVGNMRVCCYNRKHVLGTYPKNTIKEAWFSKKMQSLRESLQKLDFNQGCQLCLQQLKKDNYDYTHIKDYDLPYKEHGIKLFPQIMELEISNVCNYECIMCGGYWSSSIRKNREKLPPIKSPYDEKFVEELMFFVKFLKKINFLGGEPFANPLYYEIWDKAPNYNPNIIFYITTNGSVYNKRIEDYFKTRRFRIICSLDSLIPETYNFIRKNGSYDKVMANLREFIKQNVLHGITFCPMIQNWQEIPSLLEFCTVNAIHSLYFNYVTGPLGGKIKGIHENGTQEYVIDFVGNPAPNNVLKTLIPEVSLYTLSKEKRDEICTFLKQTYVTYPKYKYVVEPLVKTLEF